MFNNIPENYPLNCTDVFKHPHHLATTIRTLSVKAKTYSNPLSFVSLVGTAIDVKLRLKNVADPTLTSIDEDLKVSADSHSAATLEFLD